MGIYLKETFLSNDFVKYIQADVLRTQTIWYLDGILSLVIYSKNTQN